ncbi:MAG: biotin carboxylase, partial [Planctomycetes bacterium]|nr:biotin carboxylase [Planctomycetota bacterium]
MAQRRKKLKNISEIRRFFHRNETPIYFVSATNFNLLGLDEWVRNFKYINYIDCFDGAHPNVMVPAAEATPEFESIEDINNYLLQHKDVVDWVKHRGGDPKF